MTDTREHRPSPEALLEEARSEGRGRLKVFLGASPGVGKTYDMLRAAQMAKAQGVDVVVAIVETHGRTETADLVRGLEILPRKDVKYRGRSFAELDLEGLIRRRPKLALIDEFAHTNVPGSRHVKRYQDVEDVLAAGINVLTTLNVQHLESLNDIIARITGVRVQETLPDTVLEKADEIELVDLPPDELLKRLEDGKVYLGELAARAKEGFFTRGNLTALRELAMRAAAERIDQQMLSYMRRHAVQGPWPTRDRLLVCVGGDLVSRQLVRSAARLADTRGAPWIAVHVINSRASALADEVKDRIAETLRLAEQLGGEAVTIPGENVATEILAYARSRNVSQIVLGRPRPSPLPFMLRRSVVRGVMMAAREFEVTLVPAEEQRAGGGRDEPEPAARSWNWGDYVWSGAATAVACAIGLVSEPLLGAANLTLWFLLSVLAVAFRLGTAPAITTAVLGAVFYDFFFIEPRFTFIMSYQQDVVNLVLFVIAAVLMGRLGGQVRGQMQALRKTARRTANLNEFSRRVAGALGREEVLNAIVEHVRATLLADNVVITQPATQKVLPAARRGIGADYQFTESERAAAQWSWEHGEPAGYATSTMPKARWLFEPLKASNRVVGLLGLSMQPRDRPLSAGQRRLLDAIADQAAVALERVALSDQLEQRRVAGETEQLRSALLSSVSHDLRTPLVSILGAATSLKAQSERLPPASKEELLDTIIDEAERLNRFVQNLLDMTRLGYGKVELKREWCNLRELLARAASRLERRLAPPRLDLDIPDALPPVHVDPVLMEQVLVNVLDNAVKYSPPGSRIQASARAQREEIVVDVRDEGPGIPPADRERVFDIFYRVQSRDHTQPGTGLGLSICRGLLQAHGGTIRALSPLEGRGLLIRITLPRDPAAEAHAALGREAHG
jgi:two-component system sensor histidine kinase KdpD